VRVDGSGHHSVVWSMDVGVAAPDGGCASRRRPWDPRLAYASWGGAAACMVGSGEAVGLVNAVFEETL
jgi:hypothetical protein